MQSNDETQPRLHRRDICAASIGMLGLGALSSIARASTRVVNEAGHVVLLGDSIFDNKPYVGNGPAVIDQVRETLGLDWSAKLLAVDGSTTQDVIDEQVDKIPDSATHVIISSGGNDALQQQEILLRQIDIVSEALQAMYEIQRKFGKVYNQLIDAVCKKVDKVTVCTIYDPNFDLAPRQQASIAALSIFNDRITRVAFARKLALIDLRLLFDNRQDYANPIEPSSQGGQKIADQIDRIVKTHRFDASASSVFAK